MQQYAPAMTQPNDERISACESHATCEYLEWPADGEQPFD